MPTEPYNRATGRQLIIKDLIYAAIAAGLFLFFCWFLFYHLLPNAYGQVQVQHGIEITMSNTTDAHGIVQRNLDGTYYVNDAVHVAYVVHDIPIPQPKGADWTISASYNSQLPVIASGPTSWDFAGGNMTAPGTYEIAIAVNVVDETNGAIVYSQGKTFQYELVPFEPDFSVYQYPALKDAHQFVYDDRTGVIINYLGSGGHPDRRMVLQDQYRVNATIVERKFQNFTLPVFSDMQTPLGPLPNNGTLQNVPMGADYVMIPDALHVRALRGVNENTSFIYFPRAGMQNYYLTTTPDYSKIKQEDLQHAVVVNMTSTMSWPEKNNYEKQFIYDQPSPIIHGADDLQVSILTEEQATFNVTAYVPALNTLDKRYADALYFAPVAEYAYDKAYFDTKSVDVADIVAADMPSLHVGQTVRNVQSNSTVSLNVERMAIGLPDWVYRAQTLNLANPMQGLGDDNNKPTHDQIMEMFDFHAVYENTLSPILIIATTQLPDGSLQSYSKTYSAYDFMSPTEATPQKLVMDVRQNAHMLEANKSPNTTSGFVRAPWAIEHLEYSNNTAPIRAAVCASDYCHLYVETGNTNRTLVTAYNEFGGRATGYLPADVADLKRGAYYEGQLQFLLQMLLLGVTAVVVLWMVRRAFSLMGRPMHL